MKETHTTDPRRVFRNRYSAIAVRMVALPLLMWLVSRAVTWDHLVLPEEPAAA